MVLESIVDQRSGEVLEEDLTEPHCHCRMPNDGSLMVCCDKVSEMRRAHRQSGDNERTVEKKKRAKETKERERETLEPTGNLSHTAY